jgi:hypothetical protein
LGASPEEYSDLAGTVDRMSGTDLVPLYAHVSTQSEWDRYEWSWTGSLERYAQEHPHDLDAEEMRQTAAEHRREYLHGYRGILGFVTCVLGKYGSDSP